MLEEKIEKLTTEIVKLREALEKNGGAAKASGGGTTTRGADKTGDKAAAKPKFTAKQIEDKANEVKSTLSAKIAKGLISDTGASSLDDLVKNHEGKWESFMAAADVVLQPADEPAVEDEEEL